MPRIRREDQGEPGEGAAWDINRLLVQEARGTTAPIVKWPAARGTGLCAGAPPFRRRPGLTDSQRRAAGAPPPPRRPAGARPPPPPPPALVPRPPPPLSPV